MAKYEINPFSQKMERIDNDTTLTPVITVDTTLSLEMEFIEVDCTSGNVTLTIPEITPKLQGKVYFIKRLDASANTITIARSGSDTIDGQTSYAVVLQYDFFSVVAGSSSNWDITSIVNYAAVSGPTGGVSTDNALPRWDGTTGTLIQNSGVLLGDNNDMSGANSFTFDVAPSSVPDTEGTMSWNPTDWTIDLNTGQGPVLQVGQEMHVVVYNDTGAQLDNGTAVYPVGQSGGYPSVDKTLSDTHEKIQRPLWVTTMDIPDGTLGIATKQGYVRGIDTSGYDLGEEVWLSPTVLGGFTSTEPVFPDYPIRIGGVTTSHATEGVIYVDLGGSIDDTLHNAWNGCFRETFDFRVTESGGVITGTLTPTNGHPDMTMMFSDGFTMIDTDPGATITLTAGTDIAPQMNYVYIPVSTKVLTVSTSAFPESEHIPIAKLFLRSATTTGTEGAFRNQNINNPVQDTVNHNGHLQHLGERIRKIPAAWDSGTEGSITGNPTNLYFQVTSGEVYQMHKQTYPAFTMPTDDIHVVNDPTTAYRTTTDLADITVDSEGNSLNNKYFSIVLWGVANKTGEASHIMVNLPSGGYNVSEDQAIADADGLTNYNIPTEFESVGFLIGRYTMRLSGGSFTYSVSTGYQDLRGFLPNTQAGSAAGASGVTTFLGLTDTPTGYTGNASKLLRTNAGETDLEFSGVTVDASDNMIVPGTLDVTGNFSSVGIDDNATSTAITIDSAQKVTFSLNVEVSGTLFANVSGTLTGDVTGDVVGDVTGDLTGNADTATQVYVTETTTNASFYIPFTNGYTSGNRGLGTDLSLSYNPSTNTLAVNQVNATLFVGDIQGDVTGTLLTAAQPNITSVGTLTGFTSTGIDDNATAEMLEISDNSIALGNIGTIDIIHAVDDQVLRIFGGNVSGSGAGIRMYGSTHGSLPGEFRIYNNTNEALRITQAGAAYFYGGVFCTGAFTSLGIDDNATGERFQITDTAITYGTAGATYTIQHAADDQLTYISGGNAYNSGAGLRLYGGSHIGAAGDLLMHSSGVTIYLWDEDVGGHTWYCNVGDPKVAEMTLNSDGQLGLGTTNPNGTCHVHTATAGAVTAAADADDLTVENNNNSGISILSPDLNYSIIRFGGPFSNTGASMLYGYNAGSPYLKLGTSLAGGAVTIRTDIGTAGLYIDENQDSTFYGSLTIGGFFVNASGDMTFSDPGSNWYGSIVSAGGTLDTKFIWMDNDLTQRYRIGQGSEGGQMDFTDVTGIGTAFSGDVMIGSATAPSYALHAYGGADNIVGLFESSDAAARISFSDDTTTSYIQVSIGAIGDDLVFYSGSSNTMTLTSAGKLGINTTPDGMLHVVNTAVAVTASTGADEFILEHNNANMGMTMLGGTAFNCNINFGDADDNDAGKITYAHSTDKMHFYTNGTLLAMSISDEQYVGIGTSSPAALLDVYGLAELDGSAPVTARISSSRSSSAWIADSDVCALDFYSADGSGGGAGVRAAIRMHTNGVTGSFYGLKFYTDNGSLEESMIIKPNGEVAVQGQVLSVNHTDLSNPPIIRVRQGGSWLGLDDLGSFEFYTDDASGIGARSLCSMRGVNDYTIAGVTSGGRLQFYTSEYNAAESLAMTILGNGDVGIGIATPDGALHVYTGVSGATAVTWADELIIESGANVGMSILTTDTDNASLILGSPTDAEAARMSYTYDSGTPVLDFGTRVTGGALQITSGNGTTALWIDGSQNAEFSADLTVLGQNSTLIVLGKTSADSQNVGGANGTEVWWTWDTTVLKDSNFTHSTSTNASRVTVGVTGRYKITFLGNAQQTGAARATLHGIYRIDGGTTIRSGSIRNYTRGSIYGHVSPALIDIVEVTAGSYIEVGSRVEDADAVYTITAPDGTVIQSTECRVLIEKL